MYQQNVSDYISKAAPEQIPLLETLRQLIHESLENVSEDIKWRMPVFSQTKNFAYFRYAKKHITLGFYNPEKIEDPNQLLEGEGNTLKHIKIRKPEDINEELLISWLKAIAE